MIRFLATFYLLGLGILAGAALLANSPLPGQFQQSLPNRTPARLP